MTDEGPLHTRLQRAQQAKELLSHPLLKEAFHEIRQLYFDCAVQLSATDDIGRFRLLQGAVVVEHVQSHMKKYIEDGKLADADLKELQRGNDRKRFIVV